MAYSVQRASDVKGITPEWEDNGTALAATTEEVICDVTGKSGKLLSAKLVSKHKQRFVA